MSDLSKIDLATLQTEKLPERAGVYFFANKNNQVIYIGKAKNLKSRLSSYFGPGLSSKTARMVGEATYLSFIIVATEFEALLLEAKLVREKQPKYNIQLKDDKTPLYIAITKDKYPRVIALRKTQMDEIKIKATFGPFLEGQSVRKILKMVRRIIPFSQHFPTNRVCIYKQIGQCNPCPSEIELEKNLVKKEILRKRYQANIRKIKKFLSGGLTSVRSDLVLEMKEYSKGEMFEEAQKTANQIRMLDYITTPQTSPSLYMKDPNLIEDIRQKETEELKKIISPYFDIKNLTRIECFDIAHLAGVNPTASMVTFINGEPDKNYYRHFKVKINKKRSDVDSMRSILQRRVKHFGDWGGPDLIIVDGGKPQVTTAFEVLKESKIPIIGLAKRYETIVIKQGDKFIEIRPKGRALFLIQRIRNEAHRFARRLHHREVKNTLIGI